MEDEIRKIAERLSELQDTFAEIRITHFPPAQDLFISFIYAAAAHIMIDHFVAEALFPLPFRELGFVFFLLLFLSADWVSHVRIRHQLPEVFSSKALIAKYVLDLATVYLLVLTAISLIDSDFAYVAPEEVGAGTGLTASALLRLSSMSAIGLFGVFAIVAWAWDMLILHVMQSLGFKDLFIAAIKGDLLRIDRERKYTKRFMSYYEKREKELREKTAKDGQIPFWPIVGHRVKAALWRSGLWTFGELIALHVAAVNILVGGLLLYREAFANTMPIIEFRWSFWLFLCVAFIFFAIKSNVCCVFGAVTFIVFVLLGYLSLPGLWPLVVLAMEQIVIGTVLQFIISRSRDVTITRVGITVGEP